MFVRSPSLHVLLILLVPKAPLLLTSNYESFSPKTTTTHDDAQQQPQFKMVIKVKKPLDNNKFMKASPSVFQFELIIQKSKRKMRVNKNNTYIKSSNDEEEE